MFEDIEWFGQLFESLVIRDLRVLSQPLDGEVLHDSDDYGVQVNAAATSLKRFAEQIDQQRSGSSAFLAVICGKGYGYRRSDGVVVIPVRALWP